MCSTLSLLGLSLALAACMCGPPGCIHVTFGPSCSANGLAKNEFLAHKRSAHTWRNVRVESGMALLTQIRIRRTVKTNFVWSFKNIMVDSWWW